MCTVLSLFLQGCMLGQSGLGRPLISNLLSYVNDRITFCDVVSAAGPGSCQCTHECAAKFSLLCRQHAWYVHGFPKVLMLEAMAVQTSWDSSDEGAEGPAAKALRSLEQQVGSPLQRYIRSLLHLCFAAAELCRKQVARHCGCPWLLSVKANAFCGYVTALLGSAGIMLPGCSNTCIAEQQQ